MIAAICFSSLAIAFRTSSDALLMKYEAVVLKFA